jgi:hypothetical protein
VRGGQEAHRDVKARGSRWVARERSERAASTDDGSRTTDDGRRVAFTERVGGAARRLARWNRFGARDVGSRTDEQSVTFRTAEMERSAGVEPPGRGASGLPDQPRTLLGPVCGEGGLGTSPPQPGREAFAARQSASGAARWRNGRAERNGGRANGTVCGRITAGENGARQRWGERPTGAGDGGRAGRLTLGRAAARQRDRRASEASDGVWGQRTREICLMARTRQTDGWRNRNKRNRRLSMTLRRLLALKLVCRLCRRRALKKRKGRRCQSGQVGSGR